MFVVFCFPLFIAIFLLSNFDNLEDEKFSKQFGSLYLGINYKSKLALMFHVIFTFRRLLLCATAVYMSNYNYFQIQLTILINIMVIMYIILAQPFDTRMQNKLEIFNECCILAVGYTLLLFTNFVDMDNELNLQSKIGYILCGFALLNIAVNCVFILKNTICNLKKTITHYFLKFIKKPYLAHKQKKLYKNHISLITAQSAMNFTSDKSLNFSEVVPYDNNFINLNSIGQINIQHKISQHRSNNAKDRIDIKNMTSDIAISQFTQLKFNKSRFDEDFLNVNKSIEAQAQLLNEGINQNVKFIDSYQSDIDLNKSGELPYSLYGGSQIDQQEVHLKQENSQFEESQDEFENSQIDDEQISEQNFDEQPYGYQL